MGWHGREHDVEDELETGFAHGVCREIPEQYEYQVKVHFKQPNQFYKESRTNILVTIRRFCMALGT